MQALEELRLVWDVLSDKKEKNGENAVVTSAINGARKKSRSRAADKPLELYSNSKVAKVAQESAVVVTNAMNICSLPTEVLLKIFSLVPSITLLSCALTCKRWNIVVSDWSLWKPLYARHFPCAFKRSLEMNLGIKDWRAVFLIDAAKHGKEYFCSIFWSEHDKNRLPQTTFELVLLLKDGCYHTAYVPETLWLGHRNKFVYLNFEIWEDAPKFDDVIGVQVYFFSPTMCGEEGSYRQVIQNSPMQKRLVFSDTGEGAKKVNWSYIRDKTAEFATVTGTKFTVLKETGHIVNVQHCFGEKHFEDLFLPPSLNITVGCPACRSVKPRHCIDKQHCPVLSAQIKQVDRSIRQDIVVHCMIPSQRHGKITFYHLKLAHLNKSGVLLLGRNNDFVLRLNISLVLSLYFGGVMYRHVLNNAFSNVNFKWKLYNSVCQSEKRILEFVINDKDVKVELIFTSINSYSEFQQFRLDIVIVKLNFKEFVHSLV